jgi:hypothetical protein
MAENKEREGLGSVDLQDVAMCVRQLDHTIGELARRYGTAAVVVALTEVMGCASCATDSVERGVSIRALVERTSASRQRRSL